MIFVRFCWQHLPKSFVGCTHKLLFYCTIHFGKPLGECISSFFGGLLLGIITFHTSAIWGGLIVHLGIAWLMELGGYLAGLYNS